MLKTWTHVALVLVLASAISAMAADAQAKKGKKRTTPATTQAAVQRSLKGEVVSLNIETRELVLQVIRKHEPAQVTIATDANTEFFLDDSPASLVDLKPGMKVSVQPETGTATRVSAKSLTAKEERQRKQSHESERKSGAGNGRA